MLPESLRTLLHNLRISSHALVLTFLFAFLGLTLNISFFAYKAISNERALKSEVCDFQGKYFKIRSQTEALKKQLTDEKKRSSEYSEKYQESGHQMMVLDKAFQKIKAERDELREKVKALEIDVQNATETVVEQQKVLSDLLTSQKENVKLCSSMEEIQAQIARQENVIANLQKSSKMKEDENNELLDKCEMSDVEIKRITKLLEEYEDKLGKLKTDNESLKKSNENSDMELVQLREFKDKLEEEVESLNMKSDKSENTVSELKEELRELKSEYEMKWGEAESLKDMIKEIKENSENNFGDDVDQVFDVAKIKSELTINNKEKEELSMKLDAVTKYSSELEVMVKDMEESNVKYKEDARTALFEKSEAQKNLEVLNVYFKEKEVELQRELGALQVKRQQKEEDASTMEMKMRDVEAENVSMREQIESMKEELMKTERRWKNYATNLEKKAHESWVAARTAEREAEDLKREGEILRRNLSGAVKNRDSTVSNQLEDGMALLPPFLPPPPPSMDQYRSVQIPFDDGPPEGPPMPFVPPLPASIQFDSGVELPPMPPPPPHFPMASHQGPVPHPAQWNSSRDAFSPISQQSAQEGLNRRSFRGESPPQLTSQPPPFVRGAMPPSFPPPYSGGFARPPLFSNPAEHWIRPNGNAADGGGSGARKMRHDSIDSNISMAASLPASNV